MVIKLLIPLFLSLSSLGNYPYQFFDTVSLKLHKTSYYRYIRPQLRNIRSEYYHMAKKVYSEHGPITNLRNTALKLKLAYGKAYQTCRVQKKEQSYCDLDVVNILELTYKVDKDLASARSTAIKFNNKHESSVSNAIKILAHLDRIDRLNSDIQEVLELRNIISGTLYATYAPSLDGLSNKVNTLFTTVNFAFIDQLPTDLQNIFEKLLVHFITPLEEKMIYQYHPKWFKDRLGALNLSWNTFHMDLEKGSNSFPRNQIINIKIMHNRWNSILKIIF